jgi:hypothetical protein
VFGSEPSDVANRTENVSYKTLTRQAFQSNYLAFYDELP